MSPDYSARSYALHMLVTKVSSRQLLIRVTLLEKSTSVDPVKATLSMPMCEAIAAPAVGPNPGKILMTPGGNPACQNNMRGNKL